MDKFLKVAVILTAYDKMTRVVKQATDDSTKAFKKMQTDSMATMGKGFGLAATGIGIAASLSPAIEAYSELEDSALALKASMMDVNGNVTKDFEGINRLSKELGDLLPGNTMDFQNMFRVMLNNGIPAQSILSGVGKAAAYLGVQLKMPYEEAAKMAAKLRESTGTVDKDMMEFMDTIQRTVNVGVDPSEMLYAFSRSSGSLKLLGLQGLESSKQMSAVYASMIKLGMSGETVGTGITSIFNAILDPKKMAKTNEEAKKLGISFKFFEGGKFVGVQSMISQLEKLNKFDPEKRASVVNALTGGGQDASMLNNLISLGTNGIQKVTDKMNAQANLQTKVNSQLAGLKSMWESTKGTGTNALAAIGEAFAPIMKGIVSILGKLFAWISAIASEHPRLFKFIGVMAGLTSATLILVGAFMMVKGAIMAIRVAMIALNIASMSNPVILAITAIAIAVGLIITYWDKLVPFFKNLRKNLTSIIGVFLMVKGAIMAIRLAMIALNLASMSNPIILAIKAIAIAVGLVIIYWDKIVPFFKKIWKNITSIFNNGINYIFSFGTKFYEAGKNIIKNIWEGIKSMANKPVEAISNVVKAVRDFLPFSPAKRGALKDIHRIRLIETIAENIKPTAAINAISNVTSRLRASFEPNGNNQVAMAGIGGTSRNNVNITFEINLSGGASGSDANNIVAKFRENMPEFMRIFNAEMDRQNRRKY